ncbi:UvrD-helicase domain-containing protein [Labrys sp. La1]|uniref:UvrD-helicase domain-containing protein n=1 Tax=Labrys sp. La1 TaxID=3404917 RepID=UPI003EB85AAA
MSTRRISQPNTPADEALFELLKAPTKRSFIMKAGAGSGKTTSLIKALSAISDHYGAALNLRRQKIACITYTDIAANEIISEVGATSLFHVSTIHSFLWTLARPFQTDIKDWVAQRVEAKLDELKTAAETFGPRVQEKTKLKNARDIERYEKDREKIAVVPKFNYGTGSNFPKGVLGHDDILKIGTQFLTERALFRTLLAQRFPFVFVDESQDTTSGVVEALKAVEEQARGKFCLGFFGDPMQRIYTTGIGPIAVGDGWADIPKEENFRCSQTVLKVANAIRRGGDNLVQTRGRMECVSGEERPVIGSARVFVLPADGKRDEYVATIRHWIAANTDDPEWTRGHGAGVKMLVVVHKMAATRLGFGDLFGALNDNAPQSFKEGFREASLWPVRPFMTFVLPICTAVAKADEFEILSLLRAHCPLLKKDDLASKNVAELLAQLRAASMALEPMMRLGSTTTVRQVLEHVNTTELLELDPRFLSYLAVANVAGAAPRRGNDALIETAPDDSADTEAACVESFLNTPATQLWPYQTYVTDESPFSTQQGVKGAEFERVLVVLDDEEGSDHKQFSYDKFFGLAAPSDTDRKNAAAGNDTVVDRTRRLLYVCCTRALKDLAVVYFVPNVEAGVAAVRASGIFEATDVLTLNDLN